MRTFTCSQAVVGEDVLDDVWVSWSGRQITGVGQGQPGNAPERHFDGAVALPGFVDIHCHGGSGGEFSTGDQAEAGHIAAAHLRHGTTTLVASLVTADQQTLQRIITELSPLVDADVLAGFHLEGPWLNPMQAGAHDPALLRPPDRQEIAALLSTAAGRIAMVTIAPELSGALPAIEQLCSAGVVVAVGHTDCDYDTAKAAVTAGATVATHLFNRMPPLGKREPGPVLALMEDPRVTVELIADGVHIDDALLRFVASSLGPDRIAAVTDAMGGADAPDGDYLLGALAVTVRDGVARVAATDALAGSTLTMDKALRVWVNDCAVPLAAASRMCSTTPSRALGLLDRGSLASGLRADVVVLDEQLHTTAVLRAGEWIDPD